MAQNHNKNVPFKVDPELMNLSLNGCGYLGIYHVGVCSCIKKFYPQSLKNKISGGSVGALVACAFMCDVPLDICAKYVFDVSMQVRNGILGPMSPDLNIMKILYESMDAMLPSDAHLHCDGRLHVSATRFETGNNTLLTNFKTREELLQALMCSCFIPIYCGYQPPEFYGVAYCDAALSNNSPWLDENTVTVAPFSGNSDICPQNDGFFLKSLKLSNTSIGINANNMYMLFRVLFPAAPEEQKKICQQGYNDGLRYLRDNNLMPCNNCVSLGPEPDHSNCELPEGVMPIEISNEIEKAILCFQQKLTYRLLQRRSMKVLYYLNIPSIMTAKVAYVLLTSIFQKVQLKAGLNMEEIWGTFLRVLKNGLYSTTNSKSISKQTHKNSRVESTNSVQDKDSASLKLSQNIKDVPCCKVIEPCNNTSSDSKVSDSDTSSDELDEIESVPNKYSSNKEFFSISMTLSQSCQLELPHSENNMDMKTCVF